MVSEDLWLMHKKMKVAAGVCICVFVFEQNYRFTFWLG